MVRIFGVAIMVLFAAQGRPTLGNVNSTFDKAAAFTTFKTWGWTAGQPALNPDAHQAIMSAIEEEMTALGLTKVDGRGGDATLRYLAVRSTSVDLEKLEALEKQGSDKAGAEFTVGRLVIIMDDAKTNRRIWAADSIERLNPAVIELERSIIGVVARMFETYPTRQRAK